MADLLDQAHVDAGMALLRADTALTVYPDAEGNVPTLLAAPYVLVYAAIERPAGADGCALDGLSSRWDVRWYTHSVGATEYAAVAVAMRVRAALLDVRPTITGRMCGLIRQEAAQPATKDESTGTPIWDVTQVWVLSTLPG